MGDAVGNLDQMSVTYGISKEVRARLTARTFGGLSAEAWMTVIERGAWAMITSPPRFRGGIQSEGTSNDG